MFAKGPTPGATPKADVLKVFPKAYCKRAWAIGLSGYIIVNGSKVIGSGGNAAQAWLNVKLP